jgi:GDP-mannose 4,6 dehydratase
LQIDLFVYYHHSNAKREKKARLLEVFYSRIMATTTTTTTTTYNSTNNGKVALITGITGQDGSYLTELLLEKGYTVCYERYNSVVSDCAQKRKNISLVGFFLLLLLYSYRKSMILPSLFFVVDDSITYLLFPSVHCLSNYLSLKIDLYKKKLTTKTLLKSFIMIRCIIGSWDHPSFL